MNENSIHVQSRAIIIEENHILLCRTVGLNPDFYFLPGGHIEHGESAVEALSRELMEEIGFSFKIQRFLGCMEYSFDPKVTVHAKCHTHEYNFIFEARPEVFIDPKLPLKQLEDHIETQWLPLDRLNQIDLRPEPVTRLIPKWLNLNLNEALESLMVKAPLHKI